jgi:MFS family permease
VKDVDFLIDADRSVLALAMPKFLTALRVVTRPGPFRRYMIGESLSTTGTWMQVMAEGWVLTSLTSSAFVMGLANFAAGVPMLLLSMVGGSAADRLDKRRIILVCQVAQIGLASTMGVLIYTHTVQIWHVVVVAALLGTVNAFEMPAVSSLVPELVAKEELADAMAVDRSSFHFTRLVGPAAAGLVIGAWGAAVAFFFNALSFLPLMIALLTLGPRTRGTEEEEAQRSTGMKDGIAFVRRDPPTFAMISLMALMTFFPAPVLMVLLPLYSRTQLHLDATGMGLMMSVNAMGALLGSILLLGVAPEKRLGRLSLASVGVALALMGLSSFTQVWAAAGFLFLMSICLASKFGLVNTIIQERAPDHLRGRVSALSGLAFFGLQPFAALALSSFADAVGLTRAFLIGAPIYAVAALIVLAGPARKGIPATIEPSLP